MKRKIAFLFIITLLASKTLAGELMCNVIINHQQIQNTNQRLFEEMRKSIYEFLNDRNWTNHVYAIEERIECNLTLTISQQIGSGRFAATVQVQSSRPIYNTSYSSVLLNFKERDNDFQFEYNEGQALDFNENAHLSNLTSVLAFYAYVIIGLDYDSFSVEGGAPFFAKARQIVENAQSASEPGWKQYESKKNRYWLAENLTNEVHSPVRRVLYRYHRLGLDRMSEKAEVARAEIADSIKMLKKVYQKDPNSVLLIIFFTAKTDEIVSIFSEGNAMEQQKVVTALKEVDPANASKYDKIGK